MRECVFGRVLQYCFLNCHINKLFIIQYFYIEKEIKLIQIIFVIDCIKYDNRAVMVSDPWCIKIHVYMHTGVYVTEDELKETMMD